MIWEIEFRGSSLGELEECLKQGPLVVWNGNESRLLNEEFVDSLDGLRIYINSDEHGPPHFHVSYNGEDNSFNILNGEVLHPDNGLKKYFRNIKKWYTRNRGKLIECWNASRPTDCPVGQISAA